MNFLELVKLRRSTRRFAAQPVEPEKLAGLRALAGRAKSVFRVDDAELLLIAEPAPAEALRQAVVSGWQGKINPWIYFTPIPVWIVLCVDVDPDAAAETPGSRLPGAAMMLETVVLAAAEMGLGTCWMAGFNGRAVSRTLNLPAGRKPVICSPLGYPTEKGRMERLSRAVADSDRRKPLADIYELRGELP